MENNGKARWSIRAAVLGVFLLGCLAGALEHECLPWAVLTISS